MRKWHVVTLSVAAMGLAALFAAPAWLRARPAGKQAEDAGPGATALPVGQVVLFSSGVGMFQREGTVEGDARVDLRFPAGDVNDLLKSMVLRDLDGGHVSAVSYDSNAPIERTLKSFAVNLTGNPTFADILHQTRGEKVEVTLSTPGASALSGTIVGIEVKKHAVNKEVVEHQVLNLFSTDGLRSVKLSEVQRVRFLNPSLDAEVRKALDTLALSHDAQKRSVSIRFAGKGKRRVTVGYVIENPIWKTSYRLVLGAKAEEKPYLQGWAVVENHTDEDWKDVRLALVSGRPISFQMDLYQSLFLPRPVVTMELFQGLRPVAYDGTMTGDAEEGREQKRVQGQPLNSLEEAELRVKEAELRYRGAEKAARTVTGSISRDDLGAAKVTLDRYKMEHKRLVESLQLVTTATKLGDSFEYRIDRPVTLPRQKSALLPIVSQDVQATRVSVYNERVQARYPLLGLRFKNTSGLHLTQGPVTVFEGSRYAGDAQLKDVQPGEERLLSFAVDLGTEVNPVPSPNSGHILKVKAVKGVLETTVKTQQGKKYAVKNRTAQERLLLIEHPVNSAFHLVGTKPVETTAEAYRFEVKVPPDAARDLVVTEERDDFQSVALSSQSDDQVRVLLTQKALTPKVKEGLQKALALRQAVEKAKSAVAEQKQHLDAIAKDQERLRANLKDMPATANAYKRYLAKFDEQETQIEKHQAEIKALEATLRTQQKAFDDFLVAFTAE